MRRKLQRRVAENGGAMRDRTADLLRAKQALSQLSYSPVLELFPSGRVAFVAYSVMYLMYTPSFAPAGALPAEKISASAPEQTLLNCSYFVSIKANPEDA